MVASAHGIYRGGLGVHLAMVAMGGNLGMAVDLARVPASDVHRNAVMLFSESAGRFIVTVNPENRSDFEKLFESATSCACIGTVTATPELAIKCINDKPITSLAISDLKAAWKKPFGNLI
jgi:phosphoribosylformylglycinamidine synthase